ncbi:ATP-binding protein [Natrarchaeobius halalkaliphilus]|uniref:ATP-binding protein n=1 Tax=Natrarchaeobius halalkaliphilus TaxID=1679091 RepID=A0A3N6LS48_9EURY|nr:AAA family ATPase [Natrarchaeobius halalkaliphilus]RQG91327.1 ATP-binding protein [Natrarchaeobius halalkaliphilus]
MNVVICGPPGTGKTTTTTELGRRLEKDGTPVRNYHSDDFSRRTYDRLYEQVRNAPDEGFCLIDGTFYRREWHTLFRTLEPVRFVRLTASLETCLERNRHRDDAIDEQGVQVVYREFEPPEADLVIDTDERTPRETVDRITSRLRIWQESPRLAP